MFDNIKKYLEEKNTKYTSKDLLIFVKYKDLKKNYTEDDICKNYLIVGCPNKEKTEIKNVLTGDVYKYDSNNGIVDNGVKFIETPLRKGSKSYYFSKLSTVFENMRIKPYLSINKFYNEEKSVLTIKRFVKDTNDIIRDYIKNEVKRNNTVSERSK